VIKLQDLARLTSKQQIVFFDGKLAIMLFFVIVVIVFTYMCAKTKMSHLHIAHAKYRF